MSPAEMLVLALQALYALVLWAGGAALKRFWQELDEVRDASQEGKAQLAAINVQLAREYPTKDDLLRLEEKVENGFSKVSSDTEKLFDRLDRKVDKHQ